jgi:hypothetical protein
MSFPRAMLPAGDSQPYAQLSYLDMYWLMQTGSRWATA